MNGVSFTGIRVSFNYVRILQSYFHPGRRSGTTDIVNMESGYRK